MSIFTFLAKKEPVSQIQVLEGIETAVIAATGIARVYADIVEGHILEIKAFEGYVRPLLRFDLLSFQELQGSATKAGVRHKDLIGLRQSLQ